MIKSLLFTTLLAVHYTSCGDPNPELTKARILEASKTSTEACLAQHGVPIFEPLIDDRSGRDNGTVVGVIIIRCDFPPIQPTRRGEK